MTPAARERAVVRIPVLLVSAVGWGLLAAAPAGGVSCHAHAGSLASLLARGDAGRLAGGWALMLVAMMLPLMVAPVRHVRDRSFARRRARATSLFLAGYFAVWMLAGAVLLPLSAALRSAGASSALPLLGAALAVAAWQASPLKQACLNRLHAHPELPAFGLAADAGALRFGLTHGGWCVGSCWGLMLLAMLPSSGHLAAMVAASLWVWGESLSHPTPATWSLRFPAEALRLVLAQARMRAAAPSVVGRRHA